MRMGDDVAYISLAEVGKKTLLWKTCSKPCPSCYLIGKSANMLCYMCLSALIVMGCGIFLLLWTVLDHPRNPTGHAALVYLAVGLVVFGGACVVAVVVIWVRQKRKKKESFIQELLEETATHVDIYPGVEMEVMRADMRRNISNGLLQKNSPKINRTLHVTDSKGKTISHNNNSLINSKQNSPHSIPKVVKKDYEKLPEEVVDD